MLLFLLVSYLLSPYCNCARRLTRILYFAVFWSWLINLFSSSYIVIALCCLINVAHASNDTFESALNTYFAIVFLVMLTLYPALMQTFLYLRRDSLTKKGFKNKYHGAYEGLDVRKNKFLVYPLVFFYRRLLIPSSIIFYPDSFILHFATTFLTSMINITLIAYQRPFESKKKNVVHILGEVDILCLLYHFLCFTDFVTDTRLRHYVGYSAITIVLT